MKKLSTNQPFNTALTILKGGSITVQTGFWRDEQTWWPRLPKPHTPVLIRRPHWVWLSNDDIQTADLHIFGGLYITNFTNVDLRPINFGIAAAIRYIKGFFRIPLKGHSISVHDKGWLWIQDSIFKTLRPQITIEEQPIEIELAKAV